MIQTIEEFQKVWQMQADGTRKLLAALTDQSLTQAVADGHRTLARIAWHIIGTIPEMAERTGLKIDSPTEKDPVPTSAAEIKDGYDRAAKSLAEQIQTNWTDESLQIEDDMYGEKWRRGQTLTILITHEIHHRGQMTILMRQAGLTVPGIYGPAKEEWGTYKMEPPAV